MEDSLEREIQQARRREASVGVVVLNVNHFKELNKAHGHAAGDAVLHQVGEFLKRQVRSGDIPCRYKEDIFVIILPNSQPEATLKRPDQLRERVGNLRMEFNGQPLGSISVSVGVSSFPHDGGTWKDVLTVAFEGLYQSKAESSFNLPQDPEAPSPARLTHIPA
jgi:diguanylate cyclase (GGDEF)-like protein